MPAKKAAAAPATKPTAAKPVTTRQPKPTAKSEQPAKNVVPVDLADVVKSGPEGERSTDDFYNEVQLPLGLGVLRISNSAQLRNINTVALLPQLCISRINIDNLGVENIGLTLVRGENFPKEASLELIELLVSTMNSALPKYKCSKHEEPTYAGQGYRNRPSLTGERPNADREDIARLIRISSQTFGDYEVDRSTAITLSAHMRESKAVLGGRIGDIELNHHVRREGDYVGLVITANGCDFTTYATLRIEGAVNITQLNTNDLCAHIAESLAPAFAMLGTKGVSVKLAAKD